MHCAEKMIDWVYVGLSALWIGGLSLLLAAVSMAAFTASEHKQRLGQVLARSGFRLALDASMLLLCAGLAGLAVSLWEKLLWALLGLAFLISAWWDRRSA